MKGKKYHKKIIFALLLVLAGLTGCTKKDNEFNNEFVYYHAYSYENYRYDTPAIEEDTLEKIANQKKIISVLPFYYFKTSYLRNKEAPAEDECNMKAYMDGQLYSTVDYPTSYTNIFIDGYYNRDMIEACTIKSFDYDQNMIHGYLTQSATQIFGITDGHQITLEITCPIPITQPRSSISVPDTNDIVYTALSNRLYKLVTLNIAIEGIITYDVGSIPGIFLPIETITDIIKENQIEEVTTNAYIIETPLKKKGLTDLLDKVDPSAILDKRHWFSDNGIDD